MPRAIIPPRTWLNEKSPDGRVKCNGISGSLLNFFENYLSNRHQRVVLNGKESNWMSLKAGVPQGSVFGPLLFLV
jgi:ribonuclease P/MRP protein subunit RPP40